MLGILALGFLIGLQHAMEADHLAAVASLATRGAGLLDTARQGAAWGLGHTLTLLAFGGAVLIADTLVPERIASGLELAVGIMLLVLGADVLRRVVRDRVHFHVHRHGNAVHLHAHSHHPGAAHDDHAHRHTHAPRVPLRAMLVGMMHGMAGSAALIVLALETVTSPWQGLAYIAVFGLGSMVGMAMVGAIISVPLRHWPGGLTWVHNGLKALVGLFTLAIGGYIVYHVGWSSGVLT